MAVNKTSYIEKNIDDFIQEIPDVQKREDSIRLIHLMYTVSNEAPKMFCESIIGFGQYHYKYASGHEGYAPLIGFSSEKPRLHFMCITDSTNIGYWRKNWASPNKKKPAFTLKNEATSIRTI